MTFDNSSIRSAYRGSFPTSDHDSNSEYGVSSNASIRSGYSSNAGSISSNDRAQTSSASNTAGVAPIHAAKPRHTVRIIMGFHLNRPGQQPKNSSITIPQRSASLPVGTVPPQNPPVPAVAIPVRSSSLPVVDIPVRSSSLPLVDIPIRSSSLPLVDVPTRSSSLPLNLTTSAESLSHATRPSSIEDRFPTPRTPFRRSLHTPPADGDANSQGIPTTTPPSSRRRGFHEGYSAINPILGPIPEQEQVRAPAQPPAQAQVQAPAPAPAPAPDIVADPRASIIDDSASIYSSCATDDIAPDEFNANQNRLSILSNYATSEVAAEANDSNQNIDEPPQSKSATAEKLKKTFKHVRIALGIRRLASPRQNQQPQQPQLPEQPTQSRSPLSSQLSRHDSQSRQHQINEANGEPLRPTLGQRFLGSIVQMNVNRLRRSENAMSPPIAPAKSTLMNLDMDPTLLEPWSELLEDELEDIFKKNIDR